MATWRIPILDWRALPDASGNVFFEPATVKRTNDFFKEGVWVFNDTATKLSLYGAFNVPKNYAGTAKIVIVWTSTVTANEVVWDFEYRAVGGNDAESLDQATAQESVTVTDTAPGATDRRMEVPITLTAGNFAADDTVQFVISRDGADAADDLVGAAQLVDLLFEYADG